MYKIHEICLANTNSLFELAKINNLLFKFNSKGFQNPWIMESHKFQSSDKVLDVGGGYSKLPPYIQKETGCEVWVADDFGHSDGIDWGRFDNPKVLVEKNPGIKYVMELVGNKDRSSLPDNYFDVVYSVSVLEHVSYDFTPLVWKHMADLVKPGGKLIHSVEFYFPSNLGWFNLLMIALLERVPSLLPKRIMRKLLHRSPAAYTWLVYKTLGIKKGIPKNLYALNFVIDPEIMVEGYEMGWKRIVKDGLDYHHRRLGVLLLHIEK